LTPGAVLVPVLALGGAVLRGSVLYTFVFTDPSSRATLLGSPPVWGSELLALAAFVALALWAAHGETRGWVACRAVAGGLVAGLLEWFVVALWRAPLPVAGQADWSRLGPSLPLAAAGAQLTYWAVPIGVALGASALAAVLPAAAAARRVSHDGLDQVAASAGAWLLAAGVTGLAMLRSTPASPLAGVAFAAGAALLLVAQVRSEGRLAWLRRVQAGLEPDVEVEQGAAAPVGGVRPLVAELDASGVGRWGVAVHRGAAQGKAYRAGGGPRTPLARVPLDDRPLHTAWGQRIDAEGGASFAHLALGLGATLRRGVAAAIVPPLVAAGVHFFLLRG
jgi:hypothetical protein